ncbi:MAG: peptidyl-prolyl cis-trans isomerase [Pseudomonadota bacterium]
MNRIQSCSRLILSTGILLSALSLTPAFAVDPLDRVVAVVDDTVILDSDVVNGIADARHQLDTRQQSIPSDERLRAEVIRQLVLRDVQLGMIQRSGMTIDDSTLNAALADIAEKQGAPSLSAFQQALDHQQIGNYARLRKQVGEDISINRLRQQRVSARITISESDIDNFLASPQSAQLAAPEFRTAHLRVGLPNNPTAADIAQAATLADQINTDLNKGISPEQIMTRYNSEQFPVGGGDMGWRKLDELPSEFSARIEALTPNQTTGAMSAADGIHIVKLLERRSTEKTIVHQWQVRHILISPNDVVSPADAEARIQALYKRLQKGESFDTLARTYSNDTGSRRNGGSLDWVSPNEMVPVFEDYIKKTAVGDFSAPFQSQFGWHILQVQAERDQDMTEQFRRSMARQMLFQRQYPQELDNWLREVRAAAFVEIRGVDGKS